MHWRTRRWFWRIAALLVLLGVALVFFLPGPPKRDCEVDVCYFDLEE